MFRPMLTWGGTPWVSRYRGWVNDGGQDAPMGPRDQALFRDIFWVIVVVIVAVAILVAIG